MIPQHIIDQILDRLDIVEIISGYIQLKRAGRNFKANCPFHSEKTPSFMVTTDKQIYHCFGCGAGGNAISFVMKYENMTFPETLKLLADKTGVDLPRYEKEPGQESSITSKLYDINKLASDFYSSIIKTKKGEKALNYLKSRSINDDTIENFKIGYAPDGWEEFYNYFLSKKVSTDIALKAGLVIKSDKGKGYYDRFRSRIIFPVFNERGAVAAFGARVMDDSLPKYINSPETPVYSKSNILYGLNMAKKYIREKDYVLIVEGYMDVIVPYQNGINNIVATSGTALTPGQVLLIKKHTSNAVIVFDPDIAGEAASIRGLDILIDGGMNVKVVTLPTGYDPDTFVKKYGADKFNDITAKAKDLFDYKLDLLTVKIKSDNIISRAKIINEMLPTISFVKNAVIKSDYLKKLAERLKVDESAIREELVKVKPGYYQKVDKIHNDVKVNSNNSNIELYLLGLAAGDNALFSKLISEIGLDFFKDTNIKKILSILKELYDKGDDIKENRVLARIGGDDTAISLFLKAVTKAEITLDKNKALLDCINKLKKDSRDERLKALSSSLREAEISKNEGEIKDILFKIKEVHREKV